MHGNKYSAGEADEIIPVHCRCRCCLLPVIGSSAVETPLSNFPSSLEEPTMEKKFKFTTLAERLAKIAKGSFTSGNYEHEGRPGEVGGSQPGGGSQGGNQENYNPRSPLAGSPLRKIPVEASGKKFDDTDNKTVNHYTRGEYPPAIITKFNFDLRSKDKLYADNLEEALLKLPATEGELIRGISFDTKKDYDTFMSSVETGKRYVNGGFQSASPVGRKEEEDFTGAFADFSRFPVILKIQSKTARDVTDISVIGKENNIRERIIMPRSTFRVTGQSKNDWGFKVIHMKEIT
jgi:hypothetical protein